MEDEGSYKMLKVTCILFYNFYYPSLCFCVIIFDEESK